MIIHLAPQRHDGELRLSKSGDILTVNDDSFDFSGLPDGATIPAGEVPCEWLVGPVHRVAGKLHLTVLLPCGATAPAARRFPASITDPADGPIALPGA